MEATAMSSLSKEDIKEPRKLRSAITEPSESAKHDAEDSPVKDNPRVVKTVATSSSGKELATLRNKRKSQKPAPPSSPTPFPEPPPQGSENENKKKKSRLDFPCNSYKNIDLENFKRRHHLEGFEVRFFDPNQGDRLTYDMIKNYPYDSQHLLTTVGALEAGMRLPLYENGDTLFYDVLAHRNRPKKGKASYSRPVFIYSGNWWRILGECRLRSRGLSKMKSYKPDPKQKKLYTFENFNKTYGDFMAPTNRVKWSIGPKRLSRKRGEVRLLEELESLLVPGTENNDEPTPLPASDILRKTHDFKWDSTPIEIIGPWAWGWQWNDKSRTGPPRECHPERYGDYCPWAFNFTGFSFDYAQASLEGAETASEVGEVEEGDDIEAGRVSKKAKLSPPFDDEADSPENEDEEAHNAADHTVYLDHDEVEGGGETQDQDFYIDLVGQSQHKVKQSILKSTYREGDLPEGQFVSMFLNDEESEGTDAEKRRPKDVKYPSPARTTGEFSFGKGFDNLGGAASSTQSVGVSSVLSSLPRAPSPILGWSLKAALSNAAQTSSETINVETRAQVNIEGQRAESNVEILESVKQSLEIPLRLMAPGSHDSKGKSSASIFEGIDLSNDNAIFRWGLNQGYFSGSSSTPSTNESGVEAALRARMRATPFEAVKKAWTANPSNYVGKNLELAPPTSVEELFKYADGEAYGLPQNNVLLMAKAHQSNYLLRQLFHCKSLMLEARNQQYEKELIVERERIAELEKSLKDDECLSVEELEREAETLRANVEKARKEKSAAESKVTALQGKLEEKSAKFDQLQKELVTQEGQTKFWKSSFDSESARTSAALADIGKLKNDLSELNSSIEIRVAEVKYAAQVEMVNSINEVIDYAESKTNTYIPRPPPVELPAILGARMRDPPQ